MEKKMIEKSMPMKTQEKHGMTGMSMHSSTSMGDMMAKMPDHGKSKMPMTKTKGMK